MRNCCGDELRRCKFLVVDREYVAIGESTIE
jgi:hypothetical protein